MSYDFSLFDFELGSSLSTSLQAREERIVSGSTMPFDPQNPEIQRVASALRQKQPQFAAHVFDMDDVAGMEFDDEASGIQITLFAEEIGVTVPYWHEAEMARAVFTEIWGCLQVIQQITGYAIYDPQIGRLIDLEADFDEVLKTYNAIMNA